MIFEKANPNKRQLEEENPRMSADKQKRSNSILNQGNYLFLQELEEYNTENSKIKKQMRNIKTATVKEM
jgi:hypothetical protein